MMMEIGLIEEGKW